MTRTLRRWTTWLCLAGFLFAQGTLAAYACPLRTSTPPAAEQQAVVHEACPGHATAPAQPDGSPLCQSHCEGQNGVPSAAAPGIPPLVLAPFPVTLTLLTEPILASHVARTPLDAKAAAPPLALQFCRLLI